MTVSLTMDRSPTRHATVDPASVAKSPSNVTEDPLLFPADRDSPQHPAAAPLLARERTASPADDERVIDHQPGEEHATVTHTHPPPTRIAVMDGVTNTALAAVDDQVTNADPAAFSHQVTNTAPAAVSHQVTNTDPAAVNQPVTNTAPAAVSHQVTNTALAAVTDKVTNTAAPVVNNHITSPPPSQAPNLAVIQIDGQTLPRIPVILAGKQLHALLDSAATHNLVRAAHLDHGTRIQPLKLPVLLANRPTSCEMAIQGHLELQIQQHIQNIPFLGLPDLCKDIILGRPWFRENKAVLDFEQDRLIYGKTQRDTIFWIAQPPVSVEMDTHLVDKLLEDTPSDQHRQLTVLLQQHAKLFMEQMPPSITTAATMTIQLNSSEIRSQRPYRYSREKLQIIESEVAALKERNLVEASDSPYNSPIVVVPKKDGTSRFCMITDG
ncbi:uncharacterized protein LOC120351550 [Nilaparvata lugens]|uniref:uncharacterized protein LOC120351550 n=1 Tax=Nilaparvata lugens TaxID=108931 RepID=UPI00193DF0D8|nr:uncharacterized protein LOC120351550 [Nilaparvata lugens]